MPHHVQSGNLGLATQVRRTGRGRVYLGVTVCLIWKLFTVEEPGSLKGPGILSSILASYKIATTSVSPVLVPALSSVNRS